MLLGQGHDLTVHPTWCWLSGRSLDKVLFARVTGKYYGRCREYWCTLYFVSWKVRLWKTCSYVLNPDSYLKPSIHFYLWYDIIFTFVESLASASTVVFHCEEIESFLIRIFGISGIRQSFWWVNLSDIDSVWHKFSKYIDMFRNICREVQPTYSTPVRWHITSTLIVFFCIIHLFCDRV